ncbi:hypothetical protein B0H14DRAFT_34162 [Mycena olivaceomarginata]|nr:hypothetical protein B0H14DRAFT_34162 [Mycena olivaceomarginata]
MLFSGLGRCLLAHPTPALTNLACPTARGLVCGAPLCASTGARSPRPRTVVDSRSFLRSFLRSPLRLARPCAWLARKSPLHTGVPFPRSSRPLRRLLALASVGAVLPVCARSRLVDPTTARDRLVLGVTYRYEREVRDDQRRFTPAQRVVATCTSLRPRPRRGAVPRREAPPLRSTALVPSRPLHPSARQSVARTARFVRFLLEDALPTRCVEKIGGPQQGFVQGSRPRRTLPRLREDSRGGRPRCPHCCAGPVTSPSEEVGGVASQTPLPRCFAPPPPSTSTGHLADPTSARPFAPTLASRSLVWCARTLRSLFSTRPCPRYRRLPPRQEWGALLSIVPPCGSPLALAAAAPFLLLVCGGRSRSIARMGGAPGLTLAQAQARAVDPSHMSTAPFRPREKSAGRTLTTRTSPRSTQTTRHKPARGRGHSCRCPALTMGHPDRRARAPDARIRTLDPTRARSRRARHLRESVAVESCCSPLALEAARPPTTSTRRAREGSALPVRARSW